MSLAGKKILIVDDEPEVVTLLSDILAMEEAKVYSATNGSRALWMMETDTYDIIVFDLVMPVTDGIKMIEAARKEKLNTAAKYFALSGKFDKEAITALAGQRITNFLTKPVTAEKFISSLNNAINTPIPVPKQT